MVTYQWGIFWADLNPTKGSGQSGIRPVLVVSSEEVNEALPIVTILSITSLKPGREIYPIEVLLTTKVTGLSKESIAIAH
jgi:mRNA interferase MazF